MFNIFTLAFLAVFFGLALATWMTRNAAPPEAGNVVPEEDYAKDPKDFRSLTAEDLKKLGEEICKENQLRLIETLPDENEESWILENDNPVYGGRFVFTFVVRPEAESFVPLAELLKFKDFVKSMQSRKGFFFTSGYFTRDVHQPLEGVAVTLYNRLRVIGALRDRHIV